MARLEARRACESLGSFARLPMLIAFALGRATPVLLLRAMDKVRRPQKAPKAMGSNLVPIELEGIEIRQTVLMLL